MYCQFCGIYNGIFNLNYFCNFCSNLRRVVLLYGFDKVDEALNKELLRVSLNKDNIKEPITENSKENIKDTVTENVKEPITEPIKEPVTEPIKETYKDKLLKDIKDKNHKHQSVPII